MKIYNGYVVDPVNSLEGYYDIEIEDGKIKSVARSDGKVGDDGIDASGLTIVPGLCDVHVHFRDPGQTHKEDIYSGAKAALRGGFTEVVMMANTKPCIDNKETLKYVLSKGKETGLKVHACATVTKGLLGEELADMEELLGGGASGFTDDGIPIMDEALLKTAFEKTALLDVPVSLHEEDKGLIRENGINHGAASDYYGIYGSPRTAESKLIARDLELALKTGAKLNIQHISSKEGVDLVRAAKKCSSNIFAEVTPHHLSLTEEAVMLEGANAKMNPPLRTKKDRAALVEGVKDGTISIIATDHAPHSREEKDVEITKAPSGIIGLETSFSVSYRALVASKAISLSKLIELMAVNPRKLYGFKCEGISEGASADLCIFNEKESWEYKESVSKSLNTPFLNSKLPCKIHYTIVEGRIEYEGV